ncbi:hypothetical protein [Miniphocaeibacter massiliensis]|uniref:hypothetical protein n=1 Tax=Miniphocaeibacter massiliensis TaxID=2041841 RepID=UPI0013EC4352|nr:hypothetical protein [Miniphocaeibacter massiliensis]
MIKEILAAAPLHFWLFAAISLVSTITICIWKIKEINEEEEKYKDEEKKSL